MKKLLIVLISIFTFVQVKADEGMWLLTMLHQLDIENKGSNLSPEDIYSINQSSVKDAIVGLAEEDNPFRFFCSSEIVSDKGLLLTNYHCAFDLIQKHTTDRLSAEGKLAPNFIEDGFWAMNQKEELYNEGITASIVRQLIDVSDFIMPLYNQNKEWDSIQADINIKIAELVASVQDTSHYVASVKPFFEHNQYFMFVYETYKDVRLVGAPPRTIGKFGGDTDNWMWPRHTGDFAILRIYSDVNGNPASYSESNVPLKPKHHLPISLEGYEEGDFSMIMGFPGSTDRYKTSYGVQRLEAKENPSVKNSGDVTLAVYKEFMSKDSIIRTKYAAKWDGISNYWKYSIGQNRGIEALQVIDQKVAQEKELLAWIEANDERKAKYGEVLAVINEHYDKTAELKAAYNYMARGLMNSCELYMYFFGTFNFIDALYSDNDSIKQKGKDDYLAETVEHFKNYNVDVDKAVFVALSELYKKEVPQDYYPYYFYLVDKEYGGDFEKYADEVFKKSMYTNEKKMLKFIKNPKIKKVKKDKAKELFYMTIDMYSQISNELKNPEFDKNRKLLLEAIMEKNADSLFYPDANSTLRYTYGYIGGYSSEGKEFEHYTVLDGVMQKEDKTNDEFIVPAKLKDLYVNKDFGQYTNDKGELPVCFISNNDITGGNSGSGVMNSKGELIGIAFDGNWEAMTGDIIFENTVQKTISVDARYVLFIIDKYAGAGYLLNEMTIVK